MSALEREPIERGASPVRDTAATLDDVLACGRERRRPLLRDVDALRQRVRDELCRVPGNCALRVTSDRVGDDVFDALDAMTAWENAKDGAGAFPEDDDE